LPQARDQIGESDEHVSVNSAFPALDPRLSRPAQPSIVAKVCPRLSVLRVLPLATSRARGWLIAGPLRIACALGPAGIVRLKREGDKGTPAGRFALIWGYYRPDRPRPRAGGVRLMPMRRDQGWCEDPSSPRYNRPVRLPAADCTDRMWRDDHLYDLTFVLDQNYLRRAKGRGSAIFFHIARPDLSPTAGCVAISPSDMRKLAPRLARGARIIVG
jgi:L,D-peptidoglycan transpeptidase YkuD (ErfK/YbiS/YcfS/YnhG family)